MSIKVTIRMSTVPIPGSFNDSTQRVIVRMPAQFLANEVTAGDQLSWVASTRGSNFSRNRMPCHLAGRVDDFPDTEAFAIAQIERVAPMLQGIQGQNVCLGQIEYMNVVPNTRAVRSSDNRRQRWSLVHVGQGPPARPVGSNAFPDGDPRLFLGWPQPH